MTAPMRRSDSSCPVRAEQAEVARRRPQQAEQHTHRRRLARAVGSEQPIDAAPAHLHGEVVHRDVLAKPLCQSAGLNYQVVFMANRHVATSRWSW